MNANEFLKQHKDLEVFDSQLLLTHIMGHPRTWLLSHLDAPLTTPQLDSAKEAFTQLQAGTPLPYILGHWEFFGLDFNITKDVLIPRPETELLVENAIRWLNNHPEARSVIDVGTGSGAIAISIAKNVRDAKIIATDISQDALKVAKANAKKIGVENQIKFIECDLLPDNYPESFNLLCANLPYIPTQTLHTLPIYGHEPTLALDGGADGLDIYRRLLKIAPNKLAPHSLMLFEIEASQGTNAFNLAYDMLDETSIQLHQDYAGHDRLLEINLP